MSELFSNGSTKNEKHPHNHHCNCDTKWKLQIFTALSARNMLNVLGFEIVAIMRLLSMLLLQTGVGVCIIHQVDLLDTCRPLQVSNCLAKTTTLANLLYSLLAYSQNFYSSVQFIIFSHTTKIHLVDEPHHLCENVWFKNLIFLNDWSILRIWNENCKVKVLNILYMLRLLKVHISQGKI